MSRRIYSFPSEKALVAITQCKLAMACQEKDLDPPLSRETRKNRTQNRRNLTHVNVRQKLPIRKSQLVF
jgi:predicted GTPase